MGHIVMFVKSVYVVYILYILLDVVWMMYRDLGYFF
jgi:hypothetical protein